MGDAANSSGNGKATEQDTLMNDHKTAIRQRKQGRCARFVDSCWDPSKGELLGRTWLGWLELIFFYICFYSFLAVFWALCLYLFLLTLNDKTPTYYGEGTIVGINPGMGFQPWIEKEPESTLIQFDPTNNKTYSRYTETLVNYLKNYGATEGTRECNETASNADEGEKPCRFNLDLITTELPDCVAENDFGFKDGKPCVILTLNRLIGWVPASGYANNESAPEAVKDNYKPGDVAVECHGEYFADAELLGPRKYAPKSGLLGKYFPYKVNKHYQQPIAMVQFENIERSVLLMVECRAYAANIKQVPLQKLGITHFELIVEKTSEEEGS